MRVALVTTLYEPFEHGGAGRSVRDLAEDLAARGHEVQVSTLAPAGHPVVEEELGGVVVRRFRHGVSFDPFATPPRRQSSMKKLLWHAEENFRPSAHRFLRESFSRFRPEVVHTNSIAGFGPAAWSAVGRTPLVHTLRDYYLSCVRSRMYRNGRICRRRCTSCTVLKAPLRLPRRRPDHWVGISADIVERHRRLRVIGANADSSVIPNWPRIAPSPRTPAPRGTVRFGLLGRVGEDKGTWTAVEGFSRLPDAVRRRTSLLVAGGASAEEEDRLRGLEQTVPGLRYLGQRVEPDDFFRDVDVSLVPSQWYEPFGRVAAESRLAGVEILVSGVGGLPEVADRFGGRVVEDFADPAAWSAAMAAVVEEGPKPFEPTPAVVRGGPTVVTDDYLGLYQRLVG